jgi:hypothetical protein
VSASSPFRGGLDIEQATGLALGGDAPAGDAAVAGTPENARYLATTARRLFGATHGLGVSVDVTQGSERYGVVVCAADVNGTVTDLTRAYRTLPFDIRRRAALWAVEYLRLALLGKT